MQVWFQASVETLLASYRVGFGLRPEIGKKKEKYRKWPPPKNRKKIAEK